MQLRKSQHVVLEILNKKNLFSKKLSYIQAVTFSPFIDRISNLKKSHVTKKNLLCFRLSLEGKKLLKKNKLQLIKFIVKDLVKYFFPFEHINVNKLNFRYKTYSYLTSYRTKKEIQNLKLFTKFNKCNLVDTRELIQYTSKNIKKLEKIYG